MRLENFVGELIKQAVDFQTWWIDQNEKDPENFPLEFEDSNVGVWYEQFEFFCSLEEDKR